VSSVFEADAVTAAPRHKSLSVSLQEKKGWWKELKLLAQS
jgi:hypothetical protein